MTDQSEPQVLPPRRDSRGPQLIAAMLCVLAITAVVITASTLLTRHRVGASRSEQLAPGLAALTDQQLGDLLPAHKDFPAGWMPRHTYQSWDNFGYSRYHETGVGFSYRPPECAKVAFGLPTGSFGVATVAEHDPADPPHLASRADIRVEIGREFDPAVFDDMTSRLPRCSHFVADRFFAIRYAVRVLEDSHPAGGPRRLRYSVTSELGTDYYSYARLSGLIVTGTGTDGHQQLLATLFENTLDRIRAR